MGYYNGGGQLKTETNPKVKKVLNAARRICDRRESCPSGGLREMTDDLTSNVPDYMKRDKVFEMTYAMRAANHRLLEDRASASGDRKAVDYHRSRFKKLWDFCGSAGYEDNSPEDMLKRILTDVSVLYWTIGCTSIEEFNWHLRNVA